MSNELRHINRHNLEFFVNHNCMAGLELFELVQNEYSGTLKESKFEEIAEKLNIKLPALKKRIRRNIEIGAMRQSAPYRYENIGWKKRAGGEKPRNRVYDIDEQVAKEKGFKKYFRTLYYMVGYDTGYRVARKNNYKAKRGKIVKSDNVARLGDYCTVSASFVKSTTDIKSTTKTILKHLNRAVEYGMAKYIPQFKVERFNSRSEASLHYHYALSDTQKERTFFKFYKGEWQLTQRAANLVLPLVSNSIINSHNEKGDNSPKSTFSHIPTGSCEMTLASDTLSFLNNLC